MIGILNGYKKQLNEDLFATEEVKRDYALTDQDIFWINKFINLYNVDYIYKKC